MGAAADSGNQGEISGRLANLLEGRVCILGIGNRDRRDDAVGSLLAERLAGRSAALAIDAGAVPENHLERVLRSRPDTILIVDAANFGAGAGELRLIDPDCIAPSGLSTHALSLNMTVTFFRLRTRARLLLLAIQPADVSWGTELSEQMPQALDRAEAALCLALDSAASM